MQRVNGKQFTYAYVNVILLDKYQAYICFTFTEEWMIGLHAGRKL
jgi:hypothetical protein